jgi:hypothetical protein
MNEVNMLRKIACLILCTWSLGCSTNGHECEQTADCPSGTYCRDHDCVFDCEHDADCPEGRRCNSRGECEVGCVVTNGGVETCDGVDNNCDGETDEGLLNRCGECEPPDDQLYELCGDETDNDCDGETDEDFPNLGEACDNQGCPGVFVCSADLLSEICDAPEPADDDASCDGVDDDCDGVTDEDAADRGCPLTEGVCAGAVDRCLDGAWSGCDYGPDYTEDVDDWCDHTDNDCDGFTDEGAGTIMEPETGEQASDGVDNNCNGLVDEKGGMMVLIRPFVARFADVYEVGIFENPDCTGTQYGTGPEDDYPAGWPADGPASVTLYACSLPGIIPSGHLSWHRAQRACEAQDKQLCIGETWNRLCGGTTEAYPYGNLFVPGTCNDGEGGTGEVSPTGDFPGCTGTNTTYDASGNLAEWIEGNDGVYGATGGHHYLLEICEGGVNCQPVDTGDIEQYTNFKEALNCWPGGGNFEYYPMGEARPFLGARCCIELM